MLWRGTLVSKGLEQVEIVYHTQFCTPWLLKRRLMFVMADTRDETNVESGTFQRKREHPLPGVQGHLAHKKQPTPLGLPPGPRHRPTVGSYGGAVSYRRGTPVTSNDVWQVLVVRDNNNFQIVLVQRKRELPLPEV